MKLIFNSYKTTELRGFIKEHNKKIRKEISEEIKEIRKKMKAKRLINVVRKKRDEIIQIMLKNKSSFKDIKMKVSDEEKKQTEQKEIEEFEKSLAKELKDPKVYNELFGDLTKKQSDKKVETFIKVNLDKLEKSGLDIKIDMEKAKKAGVKFVKNIKPKKNPKDELKKKVDRYLKKIENKNGELYISLKDAKLRDKRDVPKKDKYANQYDRIKDLLKNIKNEKELNKLKKQVKVIVDKRFSKEKD